MSKENPKNSWYNYLDINYFLSQYSGEEMLFTFVDAASNDDLHALQRVSEALDKLDKDPEIESVAVPINLGSSKEGIWQGMHWVGLVLRREEGVIKAYYNDSCGTSMDNSIPTLRTILNNHKIAEENIIDLEHKQQKNGYDCGPWTVWNLVTLATGGNLSVLSAELKEQIPIQQRQELLEQKAGGGANSAEKQKPIKDGNEGPPIAALVEKTGKLDIKSQTPHFVANPIVYVPERKYEEYSSDEEPTDEFLKILPAEPNAEFPYYAKKVKNTPKVDFQDLKRDQGNNPKSLVVAPLLKKLEEGAFEEGDKGCLEEPLSISVGLNRMRSVSTRKNNSLKDEVDADTSDKNIKHEKFGFFWQCVWYRRIDEHKDKKVDYSEVRSFYKKLKKHDSGMAKDFLENVETGIPVPYQQLREYAKNHAKTKSLVRAHREGDEDTVVYLSLIDGDTVRFNGIYSSYLKIALEHDSPTVMSTGYLFPEGKPHMHDASEIDRNIRLITAKHIPMGVYYPEPNTCILIPEDKDTIPETFRDITCKDQTCESVAILRKVKERVDVQFIFADGNPIITTVPPRADKTKQSKYKNDIPFSPEGKKGAGYTEEDMVQNFQGVSQSHYNPYIWANNLYMNRGFAVSCKIGVFRHLVTKIRKSSGDEREAVVKELEKHVQPSSIARSIAKAWDEIAAYTAKFKDKYRQNADQKELLKRIEEADLDLADISRDFILLFSRTEIIDLVEDGDIDLEKAYEMNFSALQDILYNEEIIYSLSQREMNFDYVVDAYQILEEMGVSIEDISFDKFYDMITKERVRFEAINNSELIGIQFIIDLYDEDFDGFCALASDDAVSFLQDYHEELEPERLLEIYHIHSQLYYDLITDRDNILHDIGVENFVAQYLAILENDEQAQREGSAFGPCNPYAVIASEVQEDGCPDGYFANSETEESAEENDPEWLVPLDEYSGSEDEGLLGNIDFDCPWGAPS